MENGKESMAEKRLPYYGLCGLFALVGLALLLSFFFKQQQTSAITNPALYVEGYYIRSEKLGIVRVIPFSAPAFRSPAADNLRAIISPYGSVGKDEAENRRNLPAPQN